MAISKDKLKELDKKLIDIALVDFEKFSKIARVDKVQAYVCIERANGKSYAQIATVLDIKRESVFDRAKKCECESVK